jgi:hypothetical protein
MSNLRIFPAEMGKLPLLLLFSLLFGIKLYVLLATFIGEKKKEKKKKQV